MPKEGFPNYVKGGSGWYKPKSFRIGRHKGKIRMSRNTSWNMEKRHTFVFYKWGYFDFTDSFDGMGMNVQPFMDLQYSELHDIPRELRTIGFERIEYNDGSFSDIIVKGYQCILVEDFIGIMNDKGQQSLFEINLKLWENLLMFIQKFYSTDGFSNASVDPWG